MVEHFLGLEVLNRDKTLVWVEILNARNLTTHLYDDAEATKIFEDIRGNYLHQFQALAGKLE